MWELIVVSLALGLGLARIMVQFNIKEISANWKDYRCLPHVMMAANLFKPEPDPRSGAEFAFDNFNFCSAEIAKSALTVVLKPLFDIFYKMIQSAIQTIGFTMNLRSLAANLFHGLNSIFDIFFRRFNLTIHELRKTFILQMESMKKANGIALGSLYSGIAVIQSIMNFFQLMMTIAVAILVILVVMFIFLFFVLAPFTPLIMTTIGIVATTALAGAVGGMASTFGCFAPETQITLADGSKKPISAATIGDILIDGSVVTAVLEFANNEPLYDVSGVFVTGGHIVYKNGVPVFVRDSGAAVSSVKTDRVICLNTSSHKIVINGLEFGDWEELDDSNMREWDAFVRSFLGSPAFLPAADVCESESGVNPDVQIDVRGVGEVPIRDVKIGDYVADEGGWTKVIGLANIDGNDVATFGLFCSGASWCKDNGRWVRVAESSIWSPGPPVPRLVSLFTESGSFKVMGAVLRDFSDVGLANIEESYEFTLSRLLKKCAL
jgi:hypothetical protein